MLVGDRLTAPAGRSWPHSIPRGYHRIKRGRMGADEFTQVRNRLFRDKRLSEKAKGIFGHISTHQDGFGVSAESLARESTDGVAAIKSGLRELERFGYLVREQERLTNGRLGETVYLITDEPDELAK